MRKTYIITNPETWTHKKDLGSDEWTLTNNGDDKMQVSDGYHTMDELYDHRITLWITLCRISSQFRDIYRKGDDITALAAEQDVFQIWRSKFHSDGSEYEGWFILGMGKKTGTQISYHLPLSKWEETNFADTYEAAPEWDGHTSADVLQRLNNL